MPNYGLVINSTYNPMSFADYAAPFEKYASVYKEMVDTYDALEMEANLWEKLANEQDKSSNAYKTYLKYAADIRAAANDLAENGLSTKTRSSISELKRRYASEIKPIEELYNYRNKLAEEQRKLNPKGDMQWDVDFSNIGLDALAVNPTMTYKGRSLAEMEKAGEDMARAASSRRVLSESAQDMANLYYRIMLGYDGGDVADFLAKNVNSPAFQELMELYEQVRTTYGTNNPESIYSQDLNAIADERILTGMLKGLAYKEDYQTNYKEKVTNTKSGSGSGSTSKTTLYSTKKIYGHGNNGVSQYFDNLEDANTAITKLKNTSSETSEIADLIRLADEYASYTDKEKEQMKEQMETLLDKKEKDLTDAEKEMLADYKSKERAYNIVKKQGLSSEALINPEGFTIQYTKKPYKKGRYSFIIIPKQSYSINDSGELVENQEFNPNEH